MRGLYYFYKIGKSLGKKKHYNHAQHVKKNLPFKISKRVKRAGRVRKNKPRYNKQRGNGGKAVVYR
jgi:hypothetical protein